jgi:SRSO17 transposase
MSLRQLEFSRQTECLRAYLDGLAQAAGHSDRRVPNENYTKELMLPIERKRIESMATSLAPRDVMQLHQSLHRATAVSGKEQNGASGTATA